MVRRRAFAELVGAEGNKEFRLGDIEYLSGLWNRPGYEDGLIHKKNQDWSNWYNNADRGNNWLTNTMDPSDPEGKRRLFLDDEGTFGPDQYKAALDQGYTAPQIYQAIPGAIGEGRGLKKISDDLQGTHGQFHKDLSRDRGTWLTGYQNAAGIFGERSYDEVRKLVDAGERISLPGGGPNSGEKITPRTIWGAREGVNRIGPEARRLLLEDLQQGVPLRHKTESWKANRGYKYTDSDPGDTPGAFGIADVKQLEDQGVGLREMRSIADTKSRIGPDAAKRLWKYTDPGDADAFDMKDVRQLEAQGVSRATMRKIEAGMPTLGHGARDHLYGMNINAPTTHKPARLSNQGYKVGRSATGMRRQIPKAMTNRNAKGTWGRGSQFFKDASTY